MPASASRSVYLIERYWLPRTPFCLSSGDAGLVDLLLAARDDVEDLTSDVAFERADGIELGVPLGDAPCHIRLRLRVGSQTNDCNDVQGAVGRSVAAPVEPMPDRLAGRRRDRAHTAERGKACFGSQALRVIASR